MNLSKYLSSTIFPRNLQPGDIAPSLSLTADDGTWVQGIDSLHRNTMLLLGVKDINNSETISWIRSFDIEALRALQCKVFLISHQNFEILRQVRAENNLEMLFLTDPFAMEARKFGLSGRRPMTRNGIVLISKEGLVHTAKCGHMPFPEILQTIHEMEYQLQKEVVSENSVQIISPEKVQEFCLEFPETKIIDVRTLSEYEPDHVPNSIHIPLDELPQRHTEIGQTERIVLMCQAGQRAYSAAEFLVSIGGLEIYVSEGGMSSWTGSRRTDGKIS